MRWLSCEQPTAVVQLAHGMGEHIARYDATARALNEAGYLVYGNDHRGHGQTDPTLPGDMGVDGWNRLIDDARLINENIATSHPGLSCVLLGHSMGSMMAMQYLCRFGHTLDAAVLSGTPGIRPPLQTLLSTLIALFERWRLGPGADSEMMQNMLFGSANENFDGPDATGFEWLSRDAEQVRQYVNDPLCGFVLRTGSLVNLFSGAREAARKGNIATIPTDLPIYIFCGADDPVHDESKNLTRLSDRYRAAGLDFKMKLYPGGRHEMFNETNAEEVVGDLVAWLDKQFS
ncbi:MAG: alpha/beta hydrolase [Pseudomonadales bacterium]|nr:alpha/beta hydrolase [Pseudomonadales bacterium]MDP6470125.1 alpha/beta hydrolase [Pseudomonadales bacterium]MDP6827030.1 alpha/beta hydrolase [Pseudomonadales bacterium]MDP6972613.1 alpha/beta hydrolase [Pseudomonadales bacterium]